MQRRPADLVARVIEAQAKVLRSVTDTYVSAARALLN